MPCRINHAIGQHRGIVKIHENTYIKSGHNLRNWGVEYFCNIENVTFLYKTQKQISSNFVLVSTVFLEIQMCLTGVLINCALRPQKQGDFYK